jgi:hypothetical protein
MYAPPVAGSLDGFNIEVDGAAYVVLDVSYDVSYDVLAGAAGCAARCSQHGAACVSFDFGFEASHFLCLITPLCSYLYGGLYGGLYERAHIIRYFLTFLRLRVRGEPPPPPSPALPAGVARTRHREGFVAPQAAGPACQQLRVDHGVPRGPPCRAGGPGC